MLKISNCVKPHNIECLENRTEQFENDFSPEQSWIWIDHAPYVYTNFSRGEPSGTGDGIACVEMYTETGGWNDGFCEDLKNYVCKKPAGKHRC